MKLFLLLPFLLFSSFTFLHASCPEGHTVFLPDGSTEAFFCEGNLGDNLLVRSDNRGWPKVYVLVDENGIILHSDTSPRIPISGLESGTYRIYGVVFKGRLQEVVEQSLHEVSFSTFCHTISVNYIHVVIAETEIIGFSYADGSVENEFCATAGADDTVHFKLDQISGDLAIIAVDQNNQIVGIFNDLSIVVDDLLSGKITFYSFAYEGEVMAALGDLFVPDEIINGCYSSGPSVHLIRDVPNGGRLGFEGHGSELWLCPNDPGLTSITFSGNNFSPLSYYIFMVNDSNIIEKLLINAQADLSDFEGGVYLFFGASSLEPPVLIEGDAFDLSSAFSTDCIDWSSRIPKLIIEDFEAGELNIDGFSSKELFFCKNERPDSLRVVYQNFSAPKSAVVLTDGFGTVLDVVTGQQMIISDDVHQKMNVYGLVYSGNLLIKKGDELGVVDPADGCYRFSKVVLSIIEDNPSAKRLIHGFANDSVDFCTGDGFPFLLSLDTETSSMFPIIYTLLDAEGRVVELFTSNSFDLEGIDPGLYQLYGVSTADIGQLILGETLETDSFECFEITPDFLIVNAKTTDGGQVFFRGGQTELRLCEKISQDFKLRIFRNSASTNYTAVLTDVENKLVVISVQDSINIGDLPIGKYRVWGIGHTEDLELEIGMDIFAYPLSTNCFAISEKKLDLIIDNTEGALVQLGGNSFSRTHCIEDVPDEWLELTNSSLSELNYKFLLVDPQLQLIEVLDTNWINLSHFESGVYSIVGVSYGGSLLLQPGDLLINPPFGVASDCSEFSSNNILVNIIDVQGRNISFSGGGTEKMVCPTGSSTILNFSNPPAGNYAFLLIDDEGVLINYSTSLELDVFGLDLGNYEIRGLAYLGNLLLEVGMPLDSQNFASICYDLSVNYLDLSLVNPNGGEVTTQFGSDDLIIEIDPVDPDTVFFFNNSVSPATYRYVITDTNDLVFAVIPFDYLIFNVALFDEFRVYGLSYTGNINLGNGQAIHQVAASDDCYELSSNYVRIRLIDPVDDIEQENPALFTAELQVRLLSSNPFFHELIWKVELSNSYDYPSEEVFYQLFDVKGKLYKSGKLVMSSNSVTVRFETYDLHPGLYILRVYKEGMSQEIKILRQ